MNIKLIDIKPETNFFGLFVGENGSGKTSAAASFPRPICILDIDKRSGGINGSPWISRDDIFVERFKGDNLLEELEKVMELWDKDKNFPYKTIILDGFTSLAMILIENSFALTAKMSGNRGAQAHPKIGSVDLPGFDEYAYEQQGFKNIMTYLKYGAKANTICTAHWVDTYDDTGKINGKRVNLRPRVLPTVMIYFDDVYYFEKKMVTEIIPKVGPTKIQHHTVSFRNELARTTIPYLPNEMEITKKLFYPLLLEALQKNKELDNVA